jgi:hypothetical protein
MFGKRWFGSGTPIVAVFALAVVTLFSLARIVSAAPTVDQSNIYASGAPVAWNTVYTGHQFAQTFTVGMSGRLTRFDVPIVHGFTAQPITIDLRGTTAGQPVEPDSPVLASFTLPASSVPQDHGVAATLTTLDLSAANVMVSQGDVLAITMRSNASGNLPNEDMYLWQESFTHDDPYPRGSQFSRASSGTWTPLLTNDDSLFQTFVDVPEPAGAGVFVTVMMLAGRRITARRGRSRSA